MSGAKTIFTSTERYNPAKYLMHYMNALCSDDVDTQHTEEKAFIQKFGPLTTRETIAMEFKKYAQRIREMEWITMEEFRAEEDPMCPECGSTKVDID